MKKIFVAAIPVLVAAAWIARSGAQTPSADPLDPSFRPPAATAGSSPSNVWMTGPLAKVLQDSGTPGTAHSIVVHAAKNEIQSFQVHVRAGAAPINALTVTMSDLVNPRTKTRIAAASTDIVVYREAYQNVTIMTAKGAAFLNTTGRIPDILIPEIDPYYHQRTNAFPFTVPANNNQSVWIDVHIPPAAPSGYYTGTVTVQDGTTVLAAMPVEYAVWDWAMPSTASLPSWTAASYGGFCLQVYGAGKGCGAYPGAQGDTDFGATLVNVDAAVQMLDNRYSVSGITNIYPGDGAFTSFDKIYGPLFDGTLAHVPAVLQGAKFTSFNVALLGTQFTAPVFQNFQKHFAAKHWLTPFYFVVDEPNATDAAVWKNLISKGSQVHAFSTPSLPTLVTTDIVTAGKYGALDAIDWLVVNVISLERGGGVPMQDLSSYQRWLAANPARRFWSYLSCSSSGTCTNGIVGPQYKNDPNGYPNYNVDGTPVANRTMEWLTFMHGQNGELYYYVDVCDGPGGAATQCGHPTHVINPLVTTYYSGGWGDGTLMYAGPPSYVGTRTPIWLPSLRLKMIRDGMQDYEYLNALKNLGDGAFALQQVRSFITNTYTFNNNPAALESAREALGTKLHQLMLARQKSK